MYTRVNTIKILWLLINYLLIIERKYKRKLRCILADHFPNNHKISLGIYVKKALTCLARYHVSGHWLCYWKLFSYHCLKRTSNLISFLTMLMKKRQKKEVITFSKTWVLLVMVKDYIIELLQHLLSWWKIFRLFGHAKIW